MQSSAPSDPELLADWLGRQREPAFHALVARYAGLVHATAKRTCGDDSMAAEASQLTFIALAQKAKSLTSCASLGGWLHTTAIMQAKNLRRKSQRENRKRQLLQTAMETEPSHVSNDIWQEMQPVLDDALASLSDRDREALLLRFYRSLTICDIAATLGIATDAAQKRIDRATERLRGKLARRGCQAGGPLAGAMLAGFAADAEAIVLPVSAIATKAIAAGTVSSFSLTILLTSIAAFMKSSSLIPPIVALILAGAWTGTKYHSLSAAEAKNTRLRDDIAAAQKSRTPTPLKTSNDDGPIDWQKLATEGDNGPEMQRFQKRLKTMTREEMLASLDQIAALEVPNRRRTDLQSAVVMPLMEMDPAWVLNHFEHRLSDDVTQRRLPLQLALETWAKRDLLNATAWFDAQITAGSFNGKQLEVERASQPRYIFEADFMSVLLTSERGNAARRLSAIPENQRRYVLQYLALRLKGLPLSERCELEFANLVRRQLPADLQTLILTNGAPDYRGMEDFPTFNAYMEKIEATPAERISCVEKFSADNIRRLSNKRTITLNDLEPMREQFTRISPEAVDIMTARTLAQASKARISSMLFPQAAEIAAKYLEKSGNDAVLASFLEIAEFDKPNKELARELAGKISDETRRAEILKRFE